MEGARDLRVIPYLMEANGVVWVPDVDPVVHIAPNNGAEQLLKQGVIESELRASGFEALGVVIDANSSPITRTLQPSLHQSSPNWGTRKCPRTVYVSSCIGAAGTDSAPSVCGIAAGHVGNKGGRTPPMPKRLHELNLARVVIR